MRRSSDRTSGHRALRRRPARGGRFAWLAFGVAVLILASPLRLVWSSSALGWTFPFFLWLALIGLGVALGGRQYDGDGDGEDEDSA